MTLRSGRACQHLFALQGFTVHRQPDMTRKVTKERLEQFMREWGAAARSPDKAHFTEGAAALLLGFREQSVDVDMRLAPEPKGAFEAIAVLKDKLDLNVELASPDDFIPPSANWRERSRPIATHGLVEFLHFDFALQALAKLERGHRRDVEDVAGFLRGGFVTAAERATGLPKSSRSWCGIQRSSRNSSSDVWMSFSPPTV